VRTLAYGGRWKCKARIQMLGHGGDPHMRWQVIAVIDERWTVIAATEGAASSTSATHRQCQTLNLIHSPYSISMLPLSIVRDRALLCGGMFLTVSIPYCIWRWRWLPLHLLLQGITRLSTTHIPRKASFTYFKSRSYRPLLRHKFRDILSQKRRHRQ